MKRRVRQLEAQVASGDNGKRSAVPTAHAQVIVNSPASELRAPASAHVPDGPIAEYSDTQQVLLIGTKAGAARIRFDTRENTLKDLTRTLSKNRVLAPLEPEDSLD